MATYYLVSDYHFCDSANGKDGVRVEMITGRDYFQGNDYLLKE